LRSNRPAILAPTLLLLCHGLARGLGAALLAGGRGAGAALPLAGAGLAGPPFGIALPFPLAGLGAVPGRPIGLGPLGLGRPIGPGRPIGLGPLGPWPLPSIP
jgi:hypothetical protein